MNGDDPHTSPNAAGNWQFKSGDSGSPDNSQQDESPTAADTSAEVSDESFPAPDDAKTDALAAGNEGVIWTASEFIAHEKGAKWYGQLALGTAVLTAIVYLLTRDKISSGVVVLAAIVFGVYGARKPRTLEYRLGMSGLGIEDKSYDYEQFRSFWTTKEGAFSSITFMPLKRFMPSLTVYYSPQDEQQIMQILERHLPMENRDRDLLDRFLHRIRF